MSLSKNIGQVAGLYIGTTAPENLTLIWYDSTPAIRAHKVWNDSLSAWVMLDNTVISSITYSELVGIASGTGLAQGAWYKITDRGNALALAITANKIQYVDINGNLIIDDLVSTAVYVVNSNNLYIDDQQGVWDGTNNQLKFNFTTVTPDADSGDDFVYGRRTRSGVTSFIKYTLASLISGESGNSIVWQQGLYFNFLQSLRSQMDVQGGIVSKQYFDTNFMNMQISYNNLADSINSMYYEIQEMVGSLITNVEIYGKQFPYAIEPGTATDIILGDTLANIVQKCQRWFNQLKYASGVQIDQNFTPASTEAAINSNDDVFSAFRKLQKAINNRINEIAFINQFRNAYQYQGIANLNISHRGDAITTGELRFGFCIANVQMLSIGSFSDFVSNSGANGHVYSYTNPTSCVAVPANYGVGATTNYNVVAPVIKLSTITLWIQIMVAADAPAQNLNWTLGRSKVILFGTDVSSYLSNETPSSGNINPYGASLINLKYVGLPSSIFTSSNKNIYINIDTTIGA